MSLRANAPVFIPNTKSGKDAGKKQISKGDQLIQELASALTSNSSVPGPASSTPTPRSNIPETSCSKLPVAGIFCPYCTSGADCAFHKHAAPVQRKVQRAALVDSSSESQDFEEASTDAGGSEKWCAASDTSESSSSPRGGKHLRSLKSLNKIACRGISQDARLSSDLGRTVEDNRAVAR